MEKNGFRAAAHKLPGARKIDRSSYTSPSIMGGVKRANHTKVQTPNMAVTERQDY